MGGGWVHEIKYDGYRMHARIDGGKAALLKANFIEGRLDYRKIFDDINERVVTPFGKGWVGATMVTKADSATPGPAIVDVVFAGTAADG